MRIEVAGTDSRRFSLSCSPVRQPDGQIFLLELVADVTERERLQARLTEAERLAAAGELAAGVAHEIRNPLAAIVNATTLLGEEETLTREERANTLGAVKKEARRLNRILSDFLVFAALASPSPSIQTSGWSSITSRPSFGRIRVAPSACSSRWESIPPCPRSPSTPTR